MLFEVPDDPDCTPHWSLSDDKRSLIRSDGEQEYIRSIWMPLTASSFSKSKIVAVAIQLEVYTSHSDDFVAYNGQYGNEYFHHDLDIGIIKDRTPRHTNGWLRSEHPDTVFCHYRELPYQPKQGDVLIFVLNRTLQRVTCRVRNREPLFSAALPCNWKDLALGVGMRCGGDKVTFVPVHGCDLEWVDMAPAEVRDAAACCERRRGRWPPLVVKQAPITKRKIVRRFAPKKT